MKTNRRKYHRFAGDPCPCTVSMDSVKLHGLIVDESIDGAGIEGLGLMMMPYNKHLTVAFRDESFDGFARRASRRPDGCFNLGVVRQQDSSESHANASAMLINCYVQLKDNLAICAPVEFENDSVVVQLWDGMQFRVGCSDLLSLTRAERYEMLSADDALSRAMDMYGFVAADSNDDRRKVFEYEFGIIDECPVLGPPSSEFSS